MTEGDTGFIAYPGFYRWCNEEFDAHVREMSKLPENSPECSRTTARRWRSGSPSCPTSR